MNTQEAYRIAVDALEDRRSMPIDELLQLAGTVEKKTISGPNGETYFLEVSVEDLGKDNEIRIKAVVDLGSSFKLERIEERITVAGGGF